MLSFKETQTVQPLYDYYIETDLDSIDDQPVDYSKKYADQDSDEVCGSRKKRHLSTTSETLDTNKPDDELKVYCIEGTPLIISSASSMCDLRELGATTQMSDNETSKQHAGKKPCFQSIMYSNVTEEIDDSESIENVKVEDKSVKLVAERCSEDATEGSSFRNDEIFSKVSSPLMFSRSSSVGSLNSFEQHSIMDDRSSVSIFSTLTSGIISPSEIPDSPGGAMSPYIHKNNKTEFLFPVNDNEKSMDPILASLKDNVNEQFDNTFDDIPEDDVKVFDDEGDFSSVSNLSSLTYQTNSTRMSFTVFQRDESFSDLDHKSTIKVSYSVTSHENDIESCDKEDPSVTMQECSKTNRNCDSSLSDYSNAEPMEVRLDEDVEIGGTICTSNLNMDENEPKGAEISYPDSVNFDEEKCNPNSFDDGNGDDEKMTFLENESEEYSKENSDDEDDALLEECIKNGMPNTSPNAKNSEQTSITCNQALQIEENNQAHFSDNDASDDEDDMMEHCIQLGMPQGSPISKEEKRPENSRIPPIGCFGTNMNISSMKSSNLANHQLQSSGNCDIFPQPNFAKNQIEIEHAYSDEDESDALLDQCIKLGMPESKNTAVNLTKSHMSALQPTIRSRNQAINPLQNSAYCENDASDDENALLADCIQLGRPQSSNSNATKAKDLNNSRIVTTRPTRNTISNIPPNKPRKPDLSNHHIKSSHSNKSVQSIKKSTKPIPASGARPVSLGFSSNALKHSARKRVPECSTSQDFAPLGYRDNVPDGTSDVDEDDDDDEILSECIRAGMPSDKVPKKRHQLPTATLSKSLHLKHLIQKKTPPSDDRAACFKKFAASSPSQKQMYNPELFRAGCISPSAIIDIDSMCVYRTEDTPILSPSASISDLSTLSFSEDKIGHGNYLNNSRNSDCSSESEDDELLLQCIRSGMPGAKRAVA